MGKGVVQMRGGVFRWGSKGENVSGIEGEQRENVKM